MRSRKLTRRAPLVPIPSPTSCASRMRGARCNRPFDSANRSGTTSPPTHSRWLDMTLSFCNPERNLVTSLQLKRNQLSRVRDLKVGRFQEERRGLQI